MKQRITTEQLQELTEEQKQKLRDWWEPQEGDWFSYQDEERLIIHNNHYGLWSSNPNRDKQDWPKGEEKNALPLLSIGQMIELLHKRTTNGVMLIESNWYEYDITFENIQRWEVDMGKTNKEGNELCDALWEAIKQVS